MPGQTLPSAAWKDALVQASVAAKLPSEKELIRMLTLPIQGSDRAGIAKRVKDMRNFVDVTPPAELKQIGFQLDDNKSGLGRLFELELSTAFRNDLRSRMTNRIGRSEAGANPVARGTAPVKDAARVVAPPTKPAASPGMKLPRLDPGEMSVGPINMSLPAPDGSGNHYVVISGPVADKAAAMKLIAGYLDKKFRDQKVQAKVDTMFLPDDVGIMRPTIRVSGANGTDMYLAMTGITGEYQSEVDASTISQEEYNYKEAAKSWSRLYQRIGNMINKIPFTEFTDDGFGIESGPASGGGGRGVFKAMRGDGPPSTVTRRGFTGFANALVDMVKVTKAMDKGVDIAVWEKAIAKLGPAEQQLMQQMQQAEQAALRALRANKVDEAYAIVQAWRAPARRLYDKVAEAYWKDRGIRAEWTELRADMSSNVPSYVLKETKDGVAGLSKQQVTIEHIARINDNPFKAILGSNLTKTFGYTNSVILEDIRRIEKARQVVWGSDPLETMVRTIEMTK